MPLRGLGESCNLFLPKLISHTLYCLFFLQLGAAALYVFAAVSAGNLATPTQATLSQQIDSMEGMHLKEGCEGWGAGSRDAPGTLRRMKRPVRLYARQVLTTPLQSARPLPVSDSRRQVYTAPDERAE